MTLRPEEERSLHETPPEITPVPVTATTPQQIASDLITTWEIGLAQAPWPSASSAAHPSPRQLVLTNDVRDRMRDDLVKVINDTIRQHQGP